MLADLLRRWRSARDRRALSAVLAAAAVLVGVQALRAPAGASVTVVVAARDLGAGRVVGPGDLRAVDEPVAVAPMGAVAATAPLVGRVLAGAVRRGEPVTDVRLVGRALLASLAPGQVAVPLRPSDAGVVSLVEPGDRVDVLAAASAESPDGGTAVTSSPARVVASGARVLSVPTDGGGSGGSVLSTGSTGSGPPLLLAVDRATAAELAGAAGGRLSLQLVPG